jgi:L-aspartate oxidase
MSPHDELDLLVLGSGVAGLSAAVQAAGSHGLRTGVITKGGLDLATTRWAQGGVAAALSGDPEEIDLHLADTLTAGAGLCDVDAVRVLVDEGPRRVEDLIALGAEFDRDERGNLELAREGGHSVARVVHAGGAATGAEIERALVAAVRRTAAALFEHTFALDLIVDDGRCCGVRALGADGALHLVRARHVLLATGGAGQLFAVTTNPPVATGDGVAMALRAGVAVADLEFFQFHPTALHHAGMPRPLLSEALRGHGALLRDASGERFVDELLPRDVVSRAILAAMVEHGSDHVWLDATGLEHFDQRFPTIWADLAAAGLDPRTDWLPVAPAAHHQCGGIVTDLSGASSLPGLWAAGETSCTGVHGANRLASNSLLEGMVFGPRAVEAIAAGVDAPEPSGAMRAVVTAAARDAADVRVPPQVEDALHIGGVRLVLDDHEQVEPARGDAAPITDSAPSTDTAVLRARLQATMSADAGVLRDAERLAHAAGVVADTSAAIRGVEGIEAAEVRNLAQIARVLVAAATARTESRGTHARTDHPDTDPAQAHRLVVQHFPG